MQSWFAELLYGLLERLGGGHAVILFTMVLTAGLAGVMATSGRTGSMARTALVAAITLSLAIPLWTHRPLLFGLLGMAVAVLIFEKRASPLWLIPLAWLWVNTHGPFPLLFIYLLARLVGAGFDAGALKVDGWRYLAYGAIGVGVGMLNPFGVALLTFPFRTLAGRSEVFASITEWQSPNFHSNSGLLMVVALLVATAVLGSRRTGWSHGLAVMAFVALALYSQRNLPALAIVLAPALAAALRVERPVERKAPSKAVVWGPLAAIFAAVVLGTARVAMAAPYDLAEYPVAAYKWIDDQEGITRVVAPDIAGGYRIFDRGRYANVFIDDRFDMYPAEVASDYIELVRLNGEDPQVILERYSTEAVLWQPKRPLHHWLEESDDWTRSYSDDRWSVFVRSSSSRE